MKRVLTLLLLGLLLVVMPANTVQAATAQAPADGKHRGLSISPIRQYVTLGAGTTKTANITVANYTDKPMVVSFSIKQFSVADYSYDFQFNETVGTKLISISAPDTVLQPGDSKTIPYTVDVPRASTPGGRYYTILASATSSSGSLNEKVQAASLIYVTIDGKLTRTSNIGATSMQRLVFGSAIPFSMDVSNTGNTHYFMYLSAGLRGPLTSKSHVSESHLLLPIKTRHLVSSLPSPVLPGIYKATYGYRTEYTAFVGRSAWVVFIPPWSIALLLVVAWGGWHVWGRRHLKRKPAAEHKKDDTEVVKP